MICQIKPKGACNMYYKMIKRRLISIIAALAALFIVAAF